MNFIMLYDQKGQRSNRIQFRVPCIVAHYSICFSSRSYLYRSKWVDKANMYIEKKSQNEKNIEMLKHRKLKISQTQKRRPNLLHETKHIEKFYITSFYLACAVYYYGKSHVFIREIFIVQQSTIKAKAAFRPLYYKPCKELE